MLEWWEQVWGQMLADTAREELSDLRSNLGYDSPLKHLAVSMLLHTLAQATVHLELWAPVSC